MVCNYGSLQANKEICFYTRAVSLNYDPNYDLLGHFVRSKNRNPCRKVLVLVSQGKQKFKTSLCEILVQKVAKVSIFFDQNGGKESKK